MIKSKKSFKTLFLTLSVLKKYEKPIITESISISKDKIKLV
jgi:hypothetical protein